MLQTQDYVLDGQRADLTPTEQLVCETLAARLRLGETCWSFDTRLRRQLDSLVTKGYVREVKQWVPDALVAFPTDLLRETFLEPGYQTPAGTGTPPEDVAAARTLLESRGYVVLKAGSHRRSKERRRLAEARERWAQETVEHTRRWAEDAFAEQRRLSDRLTHVYGVARAHGATVEELAGDPATGR